MSSIHVSNHVSPKSQCHRHEVYQSRQIANNAPIEVDSLRLTVSIDPCRHRDRANVSDAASITLTRDHFVATRGQSVASDSYSTRWPRILRQLTHPGKAEISSTTLKDPEGGDEVTVFMLSPQPQHDSPNSHLAERTRKTHNAPGMPDALCVIFLSTRCGITRRIRPVHRTFRKAQSRFPRLGRCHSATGDRLALGHHPCHPHR